MHRPTTGLRQIRIDHGKPPAIDSDEISEAIGLCVTSRKRASSSENAKARLRDFGWTDDKIQAVLGKPKRGDQTELAPGSDRDGSHRALAKPRQLG